MNLALQPPTVDDLLREANQCLAALKILADQIEGEGGDGADSARRQISILMARIAFKIMPPKWR